MYSRDKIHQVLHGLDQEKISHLFADLRRESLATGSFPITVRHLESMIRMAEASAKMHLREYVRADDVDLAIQVAVGSFVSAQSGSPRHHTHASYEPKRYPEMGQPSSAWTAEIQSKSGKD